MTENNIIRLRPHHLVDIFKHIGNGLDLSKPHSYGHAQHLIADKILKNPDCMVEFVCENDDICKPCIHLMPDNFCDDELSQLDPPMSKQTYNDNLDRRLFKMLKISPGYKTTARDFLNTVLTLLPEIVPLATHPGGDEKYTENGLLNVSRILDGNAL